MGDHRLRMLFPLLVAVAAVPHTVLSLDPTVNRLPTTVIPTAYTIQLNPDMDSATINGTIRIEVITTNQSVDSIVLSMGTGVYVDEYAAVILKMDGSVQKIGAITSDDANSLVILKLPNGQTLDPDKKYWIILLFHSTLLAEPKGLFMGFYNSTSKYVASNLRPTFARDVFPCFDEPQYKVHVTLQVWRPDSHYAISTAALVSSLPSSGNDSKVLDTFAPTEPISIHSLGLFIGQMPWVESMGLRLIVPESTPSSVPYLRSLTASITSEIGPFPHDPLYLVVLPDKGHTSFSSYGFVFTSPEVYLGEVGSPLQWTSLKLQLTEEFLRQYVEYAKTPQWWSDVWLSDSVGAFLSLLFQENEPWLEDWLKIVIRSEALGSYTGPSGPVIPTEDLTRWDIENIVSNHTIKVKGLSTLLMWNATMPEGLVHKTLKEFIELPQSLVSTSDLVTLMVDNIKANMSYDVTPAIPLLPNWLVQQGSPLVLFNISSVSSFTLDQGSPCPAGGSAVLRSISIALAEGSAAVWNFTRQGQWLLNSSSQFTAVNVSQSSVINIESAPYRVNYPDSQWQTLISDLAAGWAPASVSSSLQDDAVALSLGGCLDFSIAFSVLNNTHHSSLDWWPVVKTAEAITANIGGDLNGLSAFGLYFASLFSPDQLAQLDLRSSANHSELSVARELVTPWLCRFNIGSCREAVVLLGGPLWQGNTSGIAGSDIETVACYGARYTPGALGALLSAYQSAASAWLRRYFTIALSCLNDQNSVLQVLRVISNSTGVSLRTNDSEVVLHTSDAKQILIGLASDLENTPTVINFIIAEGLVIQERYGVNTLSSVIKTLAKNRGNLSQLSALKNSTFDPYVVQSVDEALGIYNIRQTWYSVYSDKLYQVLPSGQVATSTPTTVTTTGRPATSPSTTAAPSPGSASTSGSRLAALTLSAVFIPLYFNIR